MQTVYLEANVNILIKNNHRKALYFPSIMLPNKQNNNLKNGFELLFLTLTNIHQNYSWRVLHIFMSRPCSWRRLLTGARTQVSFKILRQLWCFLLVESLILGWLGHFGFFGPLFGGLGSLSCRFISCSEELGLWLFGCLSWVFFPQGRVLFLLCLFFDSWLLPWAFPWGFGLCRCQSLRS